MSLLPAEYFDLLPDQEGCLNEGGGFLERMSACNGNSAPVQNGVCQLGDIALGKNQNLGSEILVAVCAVRSHALYFNDGNMEKESFDRGSEDYAFIKGEADNWKQGYSYGPEFLLWLPSHKTFATAHFTRTARLNGVRLGQKYLKNVATLWVEKRKRKKGNINYYIFNCRDADSDLEELEPVSVDRLKDAVKMFVAPLS